MKKNVLHEIDERDLLLQKKKLLTQSERDKLEWNASEDEEFIREIERVIFNSIVPNRRSYTKEDFSRELRPAINAAKTLNEIVGSVERMARMPYIALHSELRECLPRFIADMEARLAKSQFRPDFKKPKNEHARRVVKQIATIFQKHNLELSTYDKGPFCTTVRVVFGAANRIKSGLLPKATKPIVLDILDTKK